MRKTVLVFDSGLGGLNTLDRLVGLMSNVDFVYFADKAFCPYGNKSASFVASRVCNVVSHFANKVHLVVLACNTACVSVERCGLLCGESKTADECCNLLCDNAHVPAINCVEATVRHASKLSPNKQVTLLATNLTVQSGVYQQKFAQFGVKCLPIDCGKFVDLVEDGADAHECLSAVGKTLSCLQQNGSDVVVNGCTHFDYLDKYIVSCLSGQVLLSSANAAAYAAAKVVSSWHLCGDNKCTIRYLCSGSDSDKATMSKQSGRRFELCNM